MGKPMSCTECDEHVLTKVRKICTLYLFTYTRNCLASVEIFQRHRNTYGLIWRKMFMKHYRAFFFFLYSKLKLYMTTVNKNDTYSWLFEMKCVLQVACGDVLLFYTENGWIIYETQVIQNSKKLHTIHKLYSGILK